MPTKSETHPPCNRSTPEAPPTKARELAITIGADDKLREATLHGGFPFDLPSHLFLTIYASPLDQKSPTAKTLQACSDGPSNRFWGHVNKTLKEVFPEHSHTAKLYRLVFNLPAIIGNCPIPGPRSLNLHWAHQAGHGPAASRLRRSFETLAPRPNRLSGCALRTQDPRFGFVLEFLQALDDEVPGFVTPHLLATLHFIQEFQVQLQSASDTEGEVVASMAETEAIRNSCNLFDRVTEWAPLPLKGVMAAYRAAEPTPAHSVQLWPALPFRQALHAARGLHALLRSPLRCSVDVDELHLQHVSDTLGLTCSVRTLLSLVPALVAVKTVQPESESNRRLNTAHLGAAQLKRTRHGTLLDLLSLIDTGRPAEPGAAILAKHEDNSVVCTPAVLHPDSTLGRSRKGVETYLTWTELTNSLHPDMAPTAWQYGGVSVPYVRFGLLVDMVRIVSRFSKMFSCPTFLRDGTITLPEAAFAAACSAYKPGTQTPLEVLEHSKIAAAINACAIAKSEIASAYQRSRAKNVVWFRADDAGEHRLPFSVRMASTLTSIRQGIRYEFASESQLQDVVGALEVRAVIWFEIDGTEISPEEWLEAKAIAGGQMRLPGGQILDRHQYERENERFLLRQRVLHRMRKIPLAELWTAHRQITRDEGITLAPDEYLLDLEMRLSPLFANLQETLTAAARKVIVSRLPEAFRATLRPYQEQGLAWLLAQTRQGLGVCLADEMGLGKTLQAIGLVLALRDPNAPPSLVVAPKSVVPNWQREFARFAPQLRVKLCTEPGDLKRAHQTSGKNSVDVCITSYPRLRIDVDSIADLTWTLVCLDEGHTIKNSQTQIAQAVRTLKTTTRMALTGTPVENHATDLWSLVDWLQPGFLGSRNDFIAYTDLARSSAEKQQMLQPIRTALAPIMLRRRKGDPEVALNLPDKIRENRTCELTEHQEILYRALLATCLDAHGEAAAIVQAQAIFLKAIQSLKQICIHPEIFMSDGDSWLEDLDEYIDLPGDVLERIKILLAEHQEKIRTRGNFSSEADRIAAGSGKFQVLRDLLDNLGSTSQGIVIFTQYRRSAQLLQRFLASLAEDWQQVDFLHGGLTSAQRQQLIDSFCDRCREFIPDGDAASPVLIASLKAGGVGLNLMDANVVIHLDRWWNPAVEDQATDRVHRIGQVNTVFIHTLSAAGTIEEGIDRIMEEKRSLAADLLGAAAGLAPADILRSRDSFLDLVDPTRRYTLP